MCGATATPIANSIAELHVMHRYLHPQGLADAGLEQFDSWAATFGEVVTAPEVTVAGGLKIKSRFAKFNNIPEARSMFSVFADVKTAADLDLPRPLIAANSDGERSSQLILVSAGEELSDYMKLLGQRAKDVENRVVRPDEDNMLKIGGDGRKAALDLRLITEAYGHQPGCKLDAVTSSLRGPSIRSCGRRWRAKHASSSRS
ncbi:hypothetical protein SAMN06266982_10736 [Propioniciclava tarda]|nr:hypothetical protein SAMN06266982_10736 [Propioniciclava tarda]